MLLMLVATGAAFPLLTCLDKRLSLCPSYVVERDFFVSANLCVVIFCRRIVSRSKQTDLFNS